MEDSLLNIIYRYSNKISWLQENMNVENKKEYEGIIQGLETAINDIRDALDGIPA